MKRRTFLKTTATAGATVAAVSAMTLDATTYKLQSPLGNATSFGLVRAHAIVAWAFLKYQLVVGVGVQGTTMSFSSASLLRPRNWWLKWATTIFQRHLPASEWRTWSKVIESSPPETAARMVSPRPSRQRGRISPSRRWRRSLTRPCYLFGRAGQAARGKACAAMNHCVYFSR